jgi:aminoglycoside phosphotransferase (APT) family kinase protein
MPCGSATPWIYEPSETAVLDAVRTTLPHLAADGVRLNDAFEQSNPFWHKGTAWLGRTHVVKFAWSPEAAVELARECDAMLALAQTPFVRWMPTIDATSRCPLLIVTRRVEGAPCWGEYLHDPAVARGVAAVLGDLHDPAVTRTILEQGVEPPDPRPQADTEAIRSRLDRFLRPPHVELVGRWCDWIDRVQARPHGERVILHGDLHGYNMVIGGRCVRCVLDYDAVSFGDHHYDLRYVPGLGSSIEFLVAVADEYERRTGRTVEPAPLLAWHLRTVLGDALWRSEADVPLPDGGTVQGWIEQMRLRISRLATWRAFELP